MPKILLPLAVLSLLLSGAIFGFFYAWVCSTMWGLDAAAPQVAIAAMQAMNASVRNMAFAPAFFGTGPMLLITALAAAQTKSPSAKYFAAAGVLYLVGAMTLTMAINVPMNAALARISIPTDTEKARQIWQAYSEPWQFWNLVRTVASGIALLLTALGLTRLSR